MEQEMTIKKVETINRWETSYNEQDCFYTDHNNHENRTDAISLPIINCTKQFSNGLIECGKFRNGCLIEGFVLLPNKELDKDHYLKRILFGSFENGFLIKGQLFKYKVNRRKEITLLFFSEGEFLNKKTHQGYQLERGVVTHYENGKGVKKGENLIINARAKSSLENIQDLISRKLPNL